MFGNQRKGRGTRKVMDSFLGNGIIPEDNGHLESIFIVQIIPAENEVIVDQQCGLAVLRGADLFTPGILALGYADKLAEVSEYSESFTK